MSASHTPRRSHPGGPGLVEKRQIGSHQVEDFVGVGGVGSRILDVALAAKLVGERPPYSLGQTHYLVLGAVAQFEKATTVAKLAAARKRKRQATGKCEGRKPLAETNPEAVALAKRLARKRPKGGKMSLRAVSAELATQGYLNERGKPFNPKSVAMVAAR